MTDDQQNSTDQQSDSQQDQNQQDSQHDQQQQQNDALQHDEPKFSKAQLQQLGSLIGDISKKQLDRAINDLVLPMFEQTRRNDPSDMVRGDDNSPAKKMLNEQLFEQVMQGDVVGAFEKYQKIMNDANRSLSTKQQTELTKSLTGYAEKPHYKEVYPEMEKMSGDLIKQGWPPKAAAEHAYYKSVASFLAGDLNPGSLEMTTGGRRQPTQKAPKLPPDFKAACDRDIAKGLYKTEKEWIDNLAPQVRKNLGL